MFSIGHLKANKLVIRSASYAWNLYNTTVSVQIGFHVTEWQGQNVTGDATFVYLKHLLYNEILILIIVFQIINCYFPFSATSE